jgi:phospholipase C
MLPNIQDDAINAMLSLTQGSMSYAVYTQQFDDFLRRSRQHMTVDVQCVRSINGLANFELKTHAKSHRSQKGYNIKHVELQNFLNDVVTDSPHLGGMKSADGPSTARGGGQPTKKRNLEDPLVRASKIWKRNGVGRGRGRGGGQDGRGRPSQHTGELISALSLMR